MLSKHILMVIRMKTPRSDTTAEVRARQMRADMAAAERKRAEEVAYFRPGEAAHLDGKGKGKAGAGHLLWNPRDNQALEVGGREYDKDRMLGTALMMALLGQRNLVEPSLIHAQITLCNEEFPVNEGEMTFLDHVEAFRVMMYLNIATPKGWYGRARLWNLVYLQRLDGSFVPTPSLAQAMLASDFASPMKDNPKYFDAGALVRSVPGVLPGRAGLATAPVWATLLALALAESEGWDWVVQPEDKKAKRAELTLVGRGKKYLRRVSKELPMVEAVMPELRAKALSQIAVWDKQQKKLLKKISGDVAANKRSISLEDQFINFVRTFWRVLMQVHRAFRCFTAPVTATYTRAQRVLVLVAIWMGGLTVSVWMHAEHSVECCFQAAEYLGCGRLLPVDAECATHSTCTTLLEEPLLLQPPLPPYIPRAEKFECVAFPREKKPYRHDHPGVHHHSGDAPGKEDSSPDVRLWQLERGAAAVAGYWHHRQVEEALAYRGGG